MNSVQISEPSRFVDSDALLQASRRLDWRFLLPEPELRRVAYVGTASGALLESLELFAERLDVWETPVRDVDSGNQIADPIPEPIVEPYDVVVAHSPNYRTLERAVDIARAGGCLYVEAQGLLGLSRKQLVKGSRLLLQQPHLWSCAHHVRALRQLGMTRIAAFWFWPNLNHCTKIIPLDSSAPALQMQMSLRDPRALGALLESRSVRQLGNQLLRVAVPAFGIVALAPHASDGILPAEMPS